MAVFALRLAVVAVLSALLAGPLAGARADEAPPSVADVALDPGHSAADVGAVGGGLREYELTLDLARRLRQRLEAAGLSVLLTREDDQPLSSFDHPDPTTRIRLEQEARIGRAVPARVYLSLHFNAFANPLVRGTETYYNDDSYGPASRFLAETVQREVVAALRGAEYAAMDRGARSDLAAGKPYGHFFSLRGPFPSALLEAAFLSNAEERAWLAEDQALEAIADGCAAALRQVLAEMP